jgi:hypothetical protein
MADWFSDVEVFAVYYRAGQWSVVAPAVRELSGRHGIRRVARVLRALWSIAKRSAGRRAVPVLLQFAATVAATVPLQFCYSQFSSSAVALAGGNIHIRRCVGSPVWRA